ncbi:MAG: helix-turn-helix domain-containing protein [Limisphaerales bacterium]
MSSVAEQLRLAREAQGLSLHDLAELTKIRSDHIEALESANYDPFPAPVYIRGSVRTCANFLRMDVPAVLAALDEELSRSPEFSSPPSLSGGPRGPLDWLTYQLSRVHWRALAVIGGTVAVIAGGYYGWHATTQRLREDPLSRLGPGVHRPASIAEGDILSIPTNTPAPANNPRR